MHQKQQGSFGLLVLDTNTSSRPAKLIVDGNVIKPSAAFRYSVTFALPLLEETVVSRTLAARINTFEAAAWCLHVDGAATAVVENGKRRSWSSGLA